MSLTRWRAEEVLRLRDTHGWGGRRIAKFLGLEYGAVRSVLEDREPIVRDVRDDDFEHLVILSDTQYPYVDHDAEAAVMEYVLRTQPDQLISIGDFADLYSLSKFQKKMSYHARVLAKQDLIGELIVVEEKLQQWADLVPEAKLTWIEGNHEARWLRFFEEKAEMLMDLRGFFLYDQVRAAEIGWNIIKPYGEGMWAGKPGGLWLTHGEIARKWSGFSAKANVIEKYGHSVLTGHTHRLGAFYHTTGRQYPLGGYEIGCLCSMEHTPRATTVVDWQHGFASVYVSRKTGRFQVQLIPVVDGGFIVEGVRYGQ